MTDEFVRIRTENGMESTISAAYAEGVEGVEIIDEPATNSWGRPLPATRQNGRPAKPRTSVKAAASKRAASKRAAKKTAAALEADATPTPGGAAADSPEEGTE